MQTSVIVQSNGSGKDELDRLLKDPAVFRAVQDGDTVTLFSNPEFRKLVYRVLDSPAPHAAGS